MLLIYFPILTEAHLRGLQEYHCNGSSAGKNEKLTLLLSCMYIMV